jgi:hypothetical protein
LSNRKNKFHSRNIEGESEVEVEFLAPKEVDLKKHKPKLLPDFRVLQADGRRSAFHRPAEIELDGRTIRGAENTVRLRVASLPDFIIMKAHARRSDSKSEQVPTMARAWPHSNSSGSIGVASLVAEPQ